MSINCGTRAALAAAWGALTGFAPPVLHHVGRLAGAALLTVVGGSALVAAIGLVVSLPLLLRFCRRLQRLAAPALALTVFAAVFARSSFAIGPAISGSSESRLPATPSIDRSSDHASRRDK